MRRSDLERLERIQSKALKRMFDLPQGTPYWGMLAETGIWPLQSAVEYHRLMFYQKALTDVDSLSAKIIEDQDEMAAETWTSETKRIGRKYNLDMTIQNIKRKKKSEWKRQVKEGIRNDIESQWQEKAENMRKLRHLRQSKSEQKQYLKEATSSEAADILQMRLEMFDIGNNQGRSRICICGQPENLEHIVTCRKVAERYKTIVEGMDVANDDKRMLKETVE